MPFCRVPLIIDKTATISDVNAILVNLDAADIVADYATLNFYDNGLYMEARYINGDLNIEDTIKGINKNTGHVRIDGEILSAWQCIDGLE